MGDAVWTQIAADEFEDILYYIRVTDARPLTAQRLGEELLEIVNRHAQGLIVGHRHQAAPQDWLYLKFKRWVLFYRSHPQGIEIMRVLDGSRDLPGLFDQS
jgi:plasmid stabilization system protein ParE